MTADIGLMVVLPGGAGLRGLKFITGAATSGFVLGSIEATPDGQLSTRLRNGIIGAGEGLVGGYVVDKVIKVGKVFLPQFVAKLKSIGSSHRIEEVSGSKTPHQSVNLYEQREAVPLMFGKDNISDLLIFSEKSIVKSIYSSKPFAPIYNATNVNAQAAMNTKMRALQKAQMKAVRTQEFSDGRIRYYMAERPSKTPGLTRGASYVTELNPKTGQVRSWYESYDHTGKVNRIHPKMIDGQDIIGQHYPPTELEVKTFTLKIRGKK